MMSIFPILFLCFFLSGATALIYEVIWVRLFALTDSSLIIKKTDTACRLYEDAIKLADEERKGVIRERIKQYCLH